MLITKRSPLTGLENTLDLPITQQQLNRFWGGELVQDVFPDLSAGAREFLMTGFTEEDWNKMFPEGTAHLPSTKQGEL